MQQYRNILVHSFVNLGDVVLTTSAIALLRKQYPQARITMMARPMVKEILENNPVIDEVIIYDYRGKDKSIGKMLELVRILRAKTFDLCISFDRKLRPAVLCMLAGIKVRVGPDKVFDNKPSWITNLYTHTVKIPHDIVNTHQAETYQALVRTFTGVRGWMRPVIGRVMPIHEMRAQELLNTLPIRKIKIGLCVKGTFALKNWSQNRFAELVDRLASQYDAAFFIIGAPEDKDYAAEVIGKTNIPIANFCGLTSLLDLVALLQRIDLFITVDTGSAHIAATVDIPMVVIYGCTSPTRWHPLSDNVVMISSQEPCCPCAILAGECPGHMCMEKISVISVVEKVTEFYNLNRVC